jgi:hypothetical protein
VSSLELVQHKYENIDSEGLITESITLLNSALDWDAELKEKDKLGAKLSILIQNSTKRESFGVSEDLVKALNSARIIRNEKIVHKNNPLKYELPFLIATTFAYLVIFFVECTALNKSYR